MTMKRIAILGILCITVVSMMGCNKLRNLKNVNDITIVGLSFAKTFDAEKEKAFSEKLVGKMVDKVADKVLETEGMDEETILFYRETYYGVIELFSKYGFNVNDVRDGDNSRILKRMKGQRKLRKALSDYHTPENFASATKKQKKKTMAKIAQKLDTDAVGTIKIAVVRGRSILGDKIGLKVSLGMWTKGKKVIFDQEQGYIFYPNPENLKLRDLLIGGAAFPLNVNTVIVNKHNKDYFDELRTEFLKDLDKQLSKGLKVNISG